MYHAACKPAGWYTCKDCGRAYQGSEENQELCPLCDDIRAAKMRPPPSTLDKARDRVIKLAAVGLAAYLIYGLLHKLFQLPKCYAEYADGYTNPYPESARNEPSRDSPTHGRIVGYVHEDFSECQRPESPQ